ncbi:type II toxin-antitoxin system HipA family toxin [Lacisediminimonas sp.]|uniref:type II toxin-antitoxin system HipA family toxin n=1 Tax=Lacisediminimonas sp. TaxID=3060582 RepID=UPI0027271D98|nr:HipA domain-containing protein [Lacisediminimonas sp.]MDO8299831.1 HipA domain-containing protein [Lacisediminimonas sp.]
MNGIINVPNHGDGMHCSIEIFLDGTWRECCRLDVDSPAKGGAGSASLEYYPEYALEQTARVSMRYPVTFDFYRQPKWPAFLFDLIPQGKGRQYLLGELKLVDGPGADWALLCAGAFNPVGRLRIREANAFYQRQLDRHDDAIWHRGFELAEVLARREEFVEYLQVHGMLASGTTGVQGVAPKFMFTLGLDGLWHADGALPDHLASKHFLVKLPRGRDPSDLKILRNESAFVRVARALGLFTEEPPQLHDDFLFIERFDRCVTEGRVLRFHQESVASLVGQVGFDARPTQNEVLFALREHVSDPETATVEFLKRDVLNLAMGNTDNHARNTAVQIIGDHVRLAPLFDFAPMNLDKEGIARALRWKDMDSRELTNWGDVLNALSLPEKEALAVRKQMSAFADSVEALPSVMRKHGVDDDIIQARHYPIIRQVEQLRELSPSGAGA